MSKQPERVTSYADLEPIHLVPGPPARMLTPAQGRVLRSVRVRQRFNYRELAERAGIAYSSARYYADILQKSGHFACVSGGGRGVEKFLQRIA